jgi:hypothetical protein
MDYNTMAKRGLNVPANQVQEQAADIGRLFWS